MRSKYPRIRVEALCSIQYLDLARGEADIALRMRAPTSDDLTLVATLTHANAVFATREYAAKLPKGYGFKDVDWICWAPPFEDVPPNPQLQMLVPNFTPSFTSDNFLIQWRAAEAGLGGFVKGDVHHRFSTPTPLVPLQLDLGPFAKSNLYVVCARSALDIPRVRTVADLLVTELQKVGKR
jgi:DNA-binding transcriptional LysR family regulator